MREPAEITKESAIHIVKCKIRMMLKNNKYGILERIPLEMALKDDGPIEQVAEILWGEGLSITVDLNDKKHKEWLANGVVELDEKNEKQP